MREKDSSDPQKFNGVLSGIQTYLCLLLPERNYFKRTSTHLLGISQVWGLKTQAAPGAQGWALKLGVGQEEGFSLQNDGFASKT